MLRDQSSQSGVQQKDKSSQVKETAHQQQQPLKQGQQPRQGFKEEEEGGSVWSLLQRLKGADIVRGRKVFAVKPQFSVPDAARILSDNHISSAPVIGENGQVQGLVDFLDICYFVANNMPADEEIGTRARHDAERSLSAERMRSKTVADVMNFCGQNPLRTFNESESLSTIVSYFVEDPNASHRVVLLGVDGRCAGYLTQSDVVKYLYQNLSSPYLADLKHKTLRELRWMPRPLDLVTSEDSLRDALRSLLRANGNTLPVVDKHTGKLENNFSPSDIKGIFREDTPRFTQTIKSFLITSSPRAAFNDPQYVDWDASVQDICKKLVLGKIHHVWLIDPESCCPTGMITMSDVLHMVCQSR